MSEPIYLTTIGLFFGTIVLIFSMKYFSSVQQAKARQASDDAYRQLAAQALAAQSATSTALETIVASLGDVKARVTAVEKMLKEVE